MPKYPVPGAMGSINLMCFVLIAKYGDGLPLYRQESILARYGGELSRAAMANWIIALARQLQPLIHLLRAHQHTGALIQADETRVQVLKEPGRPATSDRPFVIGRKAWLFFRYPKGAQTSAIHYSLIETAKANGWEPYDYLNQVLRALPYADTVEKLEALLP